jgi:membrane carboxypeptidase/penicillin-binding protein PbpC
VAVLPEVTVGVWAGNFDGEPRAGSSGVTGAGPILRGVLQAMYPGVSSDVAWFEPPAVVRREEPAREVARAGARFELMHPVSGDVFYVTPDTKLS